jgi:hypothetical protein
MKISLPLRKNWPLSQISAPAIIFIKGDFPAPLSPTNPITSPCFTSKETPWSASKPPKRFLAALTIK